LSETREQHLEWEARWALPAGFAAIGSAVLALAAGIYLPSVTGVLRDDADHLIAIDRHPVAFMVAVVLQQLGLILLGAAFLYLDEATQHRLPDRPRLVRILIVAGPVLVAIGAIARQIELLGIAHGFPPGSEPEAEHLIKNASPVILGIVQAGNLALGFAYVLVSLYSRRAGLLSRMMAGAGIAIGVLNLLTALVAGGQGSALGPLQLLWQGALGVLILGRWPGGGRGPAWETGEAVPWPSYAEQAAARQEGAEEAEAAPAGAPASDSPQPSRRRSKKRKKRKRR
jgi:hypothetical protein